jgi:uncharacterized integral membrane protein (TIGR00698 family)
LIKTEDWWAVWIGGVLLVGALAVVLLNGGVATSDAPNPLAGWLGKPGAWNGNPGEAFVAEGHSIVPGLIGTLAIGLLVFGVGGLFLGVAPRRFAVGFCVLFALAIGAYLLSGQKVIKHYNLEYVLWALLVGLLISNTIGTPKFLQAAVRTEFYIKTGLVLLGAEVLFNRLLALGVPGIFVSWVVTPIVLSGTFWFGQRVLRMESPSLNMVISADMSVCGVSAAIATGAACKAKKEELSLAIGLSLAFTVVMMIAMPPLIQALGMNQVLGGAWIGGTIDATGAVAAAGTMLGPDAQQTAVTVKMIQNILIGVVAFGVAVYWVTCIERSQGGANTGVGEIWRRFPKFILGFVAASIAFTVLQGVHPQGKQVVDAVVNGGTKTLREWFFCLAFVSIGLETNFRELAQYLKSGKALVLYVTGQCFNLMLTLAMAWLMFEKVFPGAAEALRK